MLSYLDPEYQQTAEFIREGSRWTSPFRQLRDWLIEHYRGISVVNIVYSRDESRITKEGLDKRAHYLKIIVDRYEDIQRFVKLGNQCHDEMSRIANAFQVILNAQKSLQYGEKEFTAHIYDFSYLAYGEAYSRVSIDDREAIKSELAVYPGLEVVLETAQVLLIFRDEKSKRKLGTFDYYQDCGRKYLSYLLPYDEFGYVRRNGVAVHAGLKANLVHDRGTYHFGNWDNAGLQVLPLTK